MKNYPLQVARNLVCAVSLLTAVGLILGITYFVKAVGSIKLAAPYTFGR